MQTEMKYALNEICTIRTSNKRFAVDHLKIKPAKPPNARDMMESLIDDTTE